MRKLLTALWDKLLGFTVVVAWDSEHIEHKAASYREALSWMEQYPQEASVAIWNGSDRLVSHRYG